MTEQYRPSPRRENAAARMFKAWLDVTDAIASAERKQKSIFPLHIEHAVVGAIDILISFTEDVSSSIRGSEVLWPRKQVTEHTAHPPKQL